MLKDAHRWALLLKQQSLITIYRLPTKENKHLVSVFPFAANGGKFAGSVFCLQQTYGSRRFQQLQALLLEEVLVHLLVIS
jgi:hypothetical protein